MKKSNKLLLILIASSLLFSCSDKTNKGSWFKCNTSDYFNTVMQLNYFKNEKNKYSDSFDSELEKKFKNKISYLHNMFDRHYDHKDENGNIITSIKTINESYGTGEEIVCSEELYSLLKLGVELTELSNGYFNFFSGKLVNYWDDTIGAVIETYEVEQFDPYYIGYDEMNNYALATPSVEEAKSLLTFNDSKKSVIFNKLDNVTNEKGDILLREKASDKYTPEITSGGIAKGVATDIIKEDLAANGYKDGWLSSGSSSITMLSKPSFTEKGVQKISFADPRKTIIREVLLSVEFDYEFNLSTSGNYTSGKSYQFQDKDGKTIYRHHIVNPFTGDNPQFHRQLSIVSTTFSSGELDALSTALFNMSLEDALKFRKELLNKKKGYDLEIIFIDDGKNDDLVVTSTSKFNNTLKINSAINGVELVYAS